MPYELAICVANETRRNLQLSIPVRITDAYFQNLVYLIYYGSDIDRNPYTSYTANPVNPPLHPSLSVVFEIANELWNFAASYFASWWYCGEQADFNYNNATSLGVLLDSDYNIRKLQWIIARLMQYSQIARDTISGEPGYRLKFFFGFQYGDLNNTASIPYQWALKHLAANDFASCGISQRPIHEHIQYSGSATYYGSGSPDGATDLTPDPYGLVPTVGSGAGFSLRPGGTTNTFAGSSGIVNAANITIPPPNSRTQVMWACGTGQITFTFTTPTTQVSDQYAFGFVAQNRETTLLNAHIYLDKGTAGEMLVDAPSFNQSGGYLAPSIGTFFDNWNAKIVFFTPSTYYQSLNVTLAPGSTHTFTITVDGTANDTVTSGEPVLLIAEGRVLSADSICNGFGLGSGQANGQPADSDFDETLRIVAYRVIPMGVGIYAYEGGWSLGGDTGGFPLGNKVKFGDSRAIEAQTDYQFKVRKIGNRFATLGTYFQEPQWSDFYAQQGFINWTTYPIPAGIVIGSNTTPPLNDYDYISPANMSNSVYQDNTTNGFATWVFVIRTPGTYSITGTNLGTRTIWVDDVVLGGSTIFLRRGVHGIRLVGGTGAAPSQTANS